MHISIAVQKKETSDADDVKISEYSLENIRTACVKIASRTYLCSLLPT